MALALVGRLSIGLLEGEMMLGAMHSASWETDPKHFAFVLARYHFVARMLTGYGRVLEVGCGEGTGAQIVKQVVKEYHGIDLDGKLLPKGSEWHKADITEVTFWPPIEGGIWNCWDAVFALDVLEHILPAQQHKFFEHICQALHHTHGAVILGSPSLESQRYASSESKKHHVNCRTELSLQGLLRQYFHNVFLFGMNDCTLHTGYGPMTHYRIAICTGKK